MKKKRVEYCDALKLLAIFLVVVIHVLAGYRDKYLFMNSNYYYLLSFFDSFTRVGVPIFFMITGAFMLNEKKDYEYSDFLKKRIPKLIIPFVIISIFYYIYECNKVGVELSLINFIKKFTTNNIKYHLWFMYSIILIYLFIPYIKMMVKNLNRKQQRNLIILIYIFGNIFNTISLISGRYDCKILSSFVLPDLIIYTNYLLVGYYLFNNKIDDKYKKIIYILSVFSIALIPVFDYLFIDGMRNDAMFVATSMFAFFPSITLFLIFKNYYDKFKLPNFLKLIIRKCGPYIFYIYMIHVWVMEMLQKYVIVRFSSTRFASDLFLIFITVIITFVCSYVIAMLLNYLYVFIQKRLIKK